MKTAAEVSEYIRKPSWNIREIPKNLRSKEVIECYMQQDWFIGLIPTKLITPEVVAEYIQRPNWSIKHIPMHLRTREIINLSKKSTGTKVKTAQSYIDPFD